MKNQLSFYLIGLICLLSSGDSFAARHKTFAEDPSKRKISAKTAKEKSTQEKKEADQWAKARGLKTHYDNGNQFCELIAIRNGRPIYYSTKNVAAAISTAANQVRQVTPYHLDGSNILIGLWDGGSALSTHTEFGGRIIVSDGSPHNYHATHVGGTLAASGVDPRAKGMAPNATILSYHWLNDEAEMIGQAASAPGQPTKLYLSNHSYGYRTGWELDYSNHYIWFGDGWTAKSIEPFFGQYNEKASSWDKIVYDAPYFLPFKAIGNDRNDNPSSGDTVRNGWNGTWEPYNPSSHPKGDGVYNNNGFDTINPAGTAKNIMTIGAIDDAVSGMNRSLANATMSSFGGWGPVDDGRIKPDIVANGVGVYSCDDDNNSDYYRRTGTSMSCPNACGSAALLVEYYKELFEGGAMRASTLKGLIIHTADDLGRSGPDYEYGWGLMNTLTAAKLLTDYSINPIRLTEANLTLSQQNNDLTFFSNGTKPVRVTLCWTDPPAEPNYSHNNRTIKLINNLDLYLVGPDGTHLPYKLDYTNPTAIATTGENKVDNIEQVYIEVPTAGKYTIVVKFHSTKLLNPQEQWYSVLVSGQESDSDGDGMSDTWEARYFGGETNAIASADFDHDGINNLTEYITGYSPTDPHSAFEMILSKSPSTDDHSTIITWNPIIGRIYDITWTSSLILYPFGPIPLGENLPHTQNSYTDRVNRANQQNFYRINIQLDQ